MTPLLTRPVLARFRRIIMGILSGLVAQREFLPGTNLHSSAIILDPFEKRVVLKFFVAMFRLLSGVLCENSSDLWGQSSEDFRRKRKRRRKSSSSSSNRGQFPKQSLYLFFAVSDVIDIVSPRTSGGGRSGNSGATSAKPSGQENQRQRRTRKKKR